ncbi:hypothetical protein ACLB2K_004733 [Fragaria x ananassa]
MQGRRSHNLELIVYDLEIERTRRRLLRQVRAPAQIEGAMANEERKALKEFTAPILEGTHFEIRRATIQSLLNFYGKPNEDHYLHVEEFKDICGTFKYGISDEHIHLRLFPFSLKDKARKWPSSLPPNSITTWEDLLKKFLLKFFPATKTSALQTDFLNFCQPDEEPFYEACTTKKNSFSHWKLPRLGYAVAIDPKFVTAKRRQTYRR